MKKLNYAFSILYITSIVILATLSIIYKWYALSLISLAIGAIGLYLQIKQNRWGLIVSLLSNIIYAYIAYKLQYIGDATFYSFIAVPAAVVAFFIWGRHLDDDGRVLSKRMDNITRGSCLFVAVLAIFAYGKLIKSNGGIYSYLDAASTTASLFAIAFTCIRYKEVWFAWAIKFLVSIAMFILVKDVLLISLSAIYFIESIVGSIIWKAEEE